MNIEFLSIGAVMVAATLVMLLRPWRRRPTQQASSANAAALNTALYREQFADLERERSAGTLSEAEFTQSREELERRLLDDVSSGGQAAGAATAPAAPASSPAGRRTAWALVLTLPLAAAGIYHKLGTPEAMDPQAAMTVVPGEMSEKQIETMVARLAAKLEKEPNDPKGWAMLARSYHTMGRLQESAQAFERVGPALQSQPSFLAIYADVLASLAGGQLSGRPTELIEQALRVGPTNAMALSLAAAAAAQRNDKQAAIAYWQRLLKVLPPDSEDARMVQSQLAEYQGGGGEAAAQAAQQTTPAAPPVAEAAQPVSGGQEAVSGHVSLAPALAAKMKPDDTVFLFARAEQGSRMPLAIQRLTASQLPMDFKLDNSNAMNPSANLSSVPKVVVEARVSRSGNAMPAPGDLYGMSAAITPGTKGLQIVIDQVR